MITSTPDALACGCAAMAFPNQIERADVVFTGRVIEREEAAGIIVSWVPSLIAGLGAMIIGGFLGVVALRRWRDRASGR